MTQKIELLSFQPGIQSIERKCPLISDSVVCDDCGSPNFSIDDAMYRRGKRIPGRCDECGYTYGRRIAPKS